ncbi:MAG: DUF2752 domain-containing protein [Ferruginibacter sp.]
MSLYLPIKLSAQILNRFAPWLELSCWIGGLCFLAIINPTEEHFTICVFRWMGFSHCPGCGLGHSVSWIFHGDFRASWHAHPLGAVAIVVLCSRIFTLIKNLPIITQPIQHGTKFNKRY